MAYLGGSVRVGARIAEGVGHFSSSRGGGDHFNRPTALGGGYNPTDAPGGEAYRWLPLPNPGALLDFFPFCQGIISADYPRPPTHWLNYTILTLSRL